MSYKAKDLSIISENLGSLYEDGIDLDMSFKLLEDIPLKNEYKKSLRYIRQSILDGNTLADSFEQYSNLYPEFFVGLIRIGESSGNLGEILINISKFYSKQEKIKSEIVSASVYPIFLLLSMSLLSIFFIFVIVPTFYSTFSQNMADIPLSLKIINELREGFIKKPMINILFLLCWGIGIPFILIKLLKKIGIIKSFSGKFKIVKEVYEYIVILIFSIIFGSGIPINSGIELAISSTKIGFLKNELKKINEMILKGDELSNALRSSDIFISEYSLAVIGIGENSGSLPENLNKLEVKLNTKINKSIDRTMNLIQPTIIIGMAISVSVFIFIFVLPMFNMMYSGIN